ncbi:MAG: hypothetical protein AAGK37_15075 [Pseudomonadota bacterium]
MISRFAAVLLRAFLVVLLIALPSLLLPGVNSDAAQIVALVSIFAATLVIIEYASAYPGLVEFRDAPPFNRVRFASLFITVLLITLITRGIYEPTALTRVLTAVGALIGQAIDFPYSPVRLVVLMLPPDTAPAHLALVRTLAGIAYLTSLLTLAVFLIVLRLKGWPNANGSFNVWINLPTFDPTAGGDVVERLERDARFNIALGFLLPFLTPAVIKAASTTFGTMTLDHPQTLIWTVAAWSFLPASLFMRGIAMGRIASMIEEKRRNSQTEREEDAALLAA